MQEEKKDQQPITAGLKFKSIHFPGEVEVIEINEKENSAKVYVTPPTGNGWHEDWDLRVTRFGFEKGEYFEENKPEEVVIPEEILNSPEQPKKTRLSITEQQEKKDLSPFKHVTLINTNVVKYIEFDLKFEKDYLENRWHYIPRNINPEYQHEHEGKTRCIEVFCIDDKQSLNRLTKILKRRVPGRKVEWQSFDLAEYNSVEE